MSAIDEVLARLKGVARCNGGWEAHCPAHDDRHASLSVKQGEDGRVLLCCHAGEGCPVDEICAAIGLTTAGLSRGPTVTRRPARSSTPPTSPTKTARCSTRRCATAPRASASAGLTATASRLGVSTTRTRRRKVFETRRVLFRLPQVIAAVKAHETIYVAEGPKDCKALERAGCVATCNSEGAGRWHSEFAEFLRAANIVVVADKDKPGRAHAAQVAASLRGVAASVCVVEAREGKDAADHLAAGFGPEEFVHVELSVPPPEAAGDDEAPGDDTGVKLVHEAAHAEVLKGTWLDQYRWSAHEGTWRHWNGRVWERADEAMVAVAAQEMLHRHYGLALADKQSEAEYERLRALHNASCRYISVAHALAFLKGESGFYTDDKEWDRDLDTLNCADGLLDLNTQSLRPHDPAALCTMMTRWSYVRPAHDRSLGAPAAARSAKPQHPPAGAA